MTIQSLHKLFLQSNLVSIDTRKILKGCIFFAIKGERFDANTFAAEALENGAANVVIDNSEYFIDERTILVEDTLKTLQELAKYHRQYLKLPIIGLTGSNGKTTTKELIHSVLKKKYNVKATVGNLNNHIGVPLTLLSFTDETQIGIVEMGANHQREIAFLSSLAKPDYGYITNFGKAHLEGFGGVEGVIKGKKELYDYLKDQKKMVFVNVDDPIQLSNAAGIEAFSFGRNCTDCNLSIDDITANPFVQISFSGNTISTQLIGDYNANNIAAAIAIGKCFKIDDLDIKEALEAYVPDNNRSQMLKKGSNEIILDAYNANPSSMSAALNNFLQLERRNKVAILGDMFELGTESEQEHRNIVESLAFVKNTRIMFVGKDFCRSKVQNPELWFFETYDDLREHISKNLISDSTILIKGSRGMALERVLDVL
ncbi:MAG TPA: UDP-N-acetylmuramoyl-tripeptide--D-alanyl-D-alanine ligase [Flavobacterium sp.]|jgi:UDP-N-acetylmuramoyl-tripeptide--D-alanyl-D-alanine ligase